MKGMKVLLVTPAPAGSRKGNRVTALRWGRILRGLGHGVAIATDYAGQRADLLVALHAGKSASAVARFRADRPDAPLVVALTGTDLYGDVRVSPEAKRSLELADRLIVLQPCGIEELEERFRSKTRVIYQSVPPLSRRASPREARFEVCVLGHLREVKDPLRTAQAARLVPTSSRLRVLHVGGALSDEMEALARAEQAANPRYRWLGEKPRARALRLLSRCRLLSLTSISEGGANAISEAVAVGVPVVSSRISGSIGLLGEDYPGYFPTGDTQALAELLWRCESDPAYLADLRSRCERLRGLFEPAEEARRWAALVGEVVSG
jgi:putative glycosyltransferase (TIGR04348 family)